MNDIVTINGYNFFLIFQCNKFVCGRASMMMTRLFCFIVGCKKKENNLVDYSLVWVGDGTRTHDLRNHNPAL